MEQLIVTSFLPFPNIRWWAYALRADTILFDYAEHFEKMSYRNRYYIPGANNVIQLSVPLQKGRNQRTAMRQVLIDNNQKWQVQHWRALFSLYNRSPFFSHYSPELETMFEKEYTTLSAFCLDTITWLKKSLGYSFEISHTETYQQNYNGATDLRNMKPTDENFDAKNFPQYYQVFEDRNGFVPNMSALDLLFAEGPQAKQWLQENAEKIIEIEGL